jgi:hypothetical protein
VNRRQLLAELRRLFEEEQKVQWRIGDLLVREVGPPGDDHGHTGALDQIEEIASELGVAVATLLKYRRMAATYPDDTRISSASWSAHEAASTARDPAKVMAEAERAAQKEAARQETKTGKHIRPRVSVGVVREIAAKPQHQKETSQPSRSRQSRESAGGWGLEFLSAMDGVTNNLRRIVTMLQALDRDELTDDSLRMLVRAMDRSEQHISWIRAYVRGEDVADEASEFLQRLA